MSSVPIGGIVALYHITKAGIETLLFLVDKFFRRIRANFDILKINEI